MGVSIFPIALVGLGLLLGCVVGLGVLWYRVLRNPRDGLPTCGRCGYAVHGLTAMTCPECGCDFRQVGIDTPKQRGTVGPAWFLILWTMLLPMPAAVSVLLAAALGPTYKVTIENLTLTPNTSSGYKEIDVSTSSHGPSFGDVFFIVGANPDVLDVTMLPSASNTNWAWMKVDTTTWTWQDPSATTNASPLDEQAVLNWMSTANINTSDPAVQEQARELLRILTEAPTVGLQNVQTGVFSATRSSWQNQFPAPWFVLAVGLFWLAVWVGGIVIYIRLRRRRQQRWQWRMDAARGAEATPAG